MAFVIDFVICGMGMLSTRMSFEHIETWKNGQNFLIISNVHFISTFIILGMGSAHESRCYYGILVTLQTVSEIDPRLVSYCKLLCIIANADS